MLLESESLDKDQRTVCFLIQLWIFRRDSWSQPHLESDRLIQTLIFGQMQLQRLSQKTRTGTLKVRVQQNQVQQSQ